MHTRIVAPQFVPRPVLLVPVNYYRVPPGHWKQWQKHRPPRWGNEWGREWADKRAWNDDRDRGDGRADRIAEGITAGIADGPEAEGEVVLGGGGEGVCEICGRLVWGCLHRDLAG